ncbi:hypothetical protein [Actinoplanes teichomyceticus]|uniref:hypothetical protein n=1 Tax=Actinoplanes teichomyceticus TaxID=1867 RepID=UPI0011A45911|nr:hypothetical protein [Actinoplanes teichomyceticus]
MHNLTDRIAEARINGWLGEVQGLQTSLTKAQEKLAGLDRSIERNRSTRHPRQPWHADHRGHPTAPCRRWTRLKS